MCGRFTMADPRAIVARFSRFRFLDNVERSFNVAPTHLVLGVCNDTPEAAGVLVWGFPSLRAAGPNDSQRTVNARSETVAEKPMFREAFHRRRCIVFADGYFEWMTQGQKKRPFYFTIDNGAPFAFAGLWIRDARPDRRLCCLLTTQPNALQRRVHDRAPVMLLDDDAIDVWLRGGSPAELLELCAAANASRITAREVSMSVNNVRINDERCLSDPAPDNALTLF